MRWHGLGRRWLRYVNAGHIAGAALARDGERRVAEVEVADWLWPGTPHHSRDGAKRGLL